MTLDLQLAYRAAVLAQAAYSGNPADVLPPGTNVRVFSHGFVATSDTECWLVFRGTSDPLDWVTDLDVVQMTSPNFPGKVHAGFAMAESGTWAATATLLPSDRPVYVAGHSLGGALAVLAAWRLNRLLGYDVRGVYTFGCPRVGNAAFAVANTLPHYRIVNGNDPIPHIPLSLVLVGLTAYIYAHAGVFEHLTDGGVSEGNASWRTRSAFVMGEVERAGAVPQMFLNDHRIEYYVARLGKLSGAKA